MIFFNVHIEPVNLVYGKLLGIFLTSSVFRRRGSVCVHIFRVWNISLIMPHIDVHGSCLRLVYFIHSWMNNGHFTIYHPGPEDSDEYSLALSVEDNP